MSTNWTNASVAEAAWEMISIVNESQHSKALIAEGLPSGVLFEAMEDLVGFAVRNPDVMPAWLHDRYSHFLHSKGFSWEAVTDVAKKKSRALVQWSELGPGETTEYAIFMGVLRIITKGPSKKTAAKKPGPKTGRKKAAADAAAADAAAGGGAPAAGGDKEDAVVI